MERSGDRPIQLIVGILGLNWLPDPVGLVFCLAGLSAQVFVARRLQVPKLLNYGTALLLGIAFLLTAERAIYSLWRLFPFSLVHDYIPAGILIWSILFVGAASLVWLFDRVPRFNRHRRGFLQASTVVACALPAVALGAGIITRKDFRVSQVNLRFPRLPKDLDGLKLLQISDIHLGAFFSRSDLRRVIDAANSLRADLAFITGDLITTNRDPLDDCLLELQRLRSFNGVWGCMGNHEMYAGCQTYTKRHAKSLGMDFLRYEGRSLRFGSSKMNIVGVDYQSAHEQLPGIDDLVAPDAFNLLLSHSPAIFPNAKEKGFQLTLAGHTHGGQINLELAGMNFNLVDVSTPYTRGLYELPGSKIYVNSGLGTIGIPVRIGAPPEISVIRLCSS